LQLRLRHSDFDCTRRRFLLRSVRPGHSADEVRAQIGFDYDVPAAVPVTAQPDAATLALIRGTVREQIGRAYPRFAATQP